MENELHDQFEQAFKTLLQVKKVLKKNKPKVEKVKLEKVTTPKVVKEKKVSKKKADKLSK